MCGRNAVLIAVVALSVSAVFQAFRATPIVKVDFTNLGLAVTIALLLLLAANSK